MKPSLFELTPTCGTRRSTRVSRAARRGQIAMMSIALLACAACGDDAATPEENRERDAKVTRPRDAGAHVDAARGDAGKKLIDASTIDARATVAAFALATAELVTIRPRKVIDVAAADPTERDAATSLWPVHAQVEFRTTPESVDLSVSLESCRTAWSYPLVIHAQADCSDVPPVTREWKSKPGFIPSAFCTTGGRGTTFHLRANDAVGAWSLGDGSERDIVGRVLALHDPETFEPLACGKIVAEEDAGRFDPEVRVALPRAEVLAELGGYCLAKLFDIAPREAGAPACPDVEKLADCAGTHCVAHCLEPCAEYVACLDQAAEICSGECFPSDACGACLADNRCALGFCSDLVSCAPPPTPGGPCTQLRECCMRQGPLTETCLEVVHRVELVSGDSTCRGGLDDWDFNTNFTYRSPCYTDAGARRDEE